MSAISEPIPDPIPDPIPEAIPATTNMANENSSEDFTSIPSARSTPPPTSTTSTTSPPLHAALSTPEAHRLRDAALALAQALFAFLCMLYASILTAMESRFKITPASDQNVLSRTSAVLSKTAPRVQRAACGAANFAAYMLNAASRFSGPGSQVVVPAANQVISMLPDDAKRAVRDSNRPDPNDNAPPSITTSN